MIAGATAFAIGARCSSAILRKNPLANPAIVECTAFNRGLMSRALVISMPSGTRRSKLQPKTHVLKNLSATSSLTSQPPSDTLRANSNAHSLYVIELRQQLVMFRCATSGHDLVKPRHKRTRQAVVHRCVCQSCDGGFVFGAVRAFCSGFSQVAHRWSDVWPRLFDLFPRKAACRYP